MPKSTKSTRKPRKVVLETPVLETPVVETPVVENPVVETPIVQPVGKPVVEEKTKAKRASRKPSAYNLFLKKMMATDEVKKLPARDRMRFIGILWKQQKEKQMIKG